MLYGDQTACEEIFLQGQPRMLTRDLFALLSLFVLEKYTLRIIVITVTISCRLPFVILPYELCWAFTVKVASVSELDVKYALPPGE